MSGNDDRAAMVLLARTPFLRAHERRTLLACCPSYAELLQVSHGEIEQIIGRAIRRERWSPQQEQRAVELSLRELERLDCAVVAIDDADFPPLLRAISDPPAFLFVRGAVPAVHATGVAVVGTRHPTAAAVRAAADLGREAAEQGWVVISGLAYGCDAAAHAGMVRAHGIGVAVLGTGIDQLSPRANRSLAVGILREGGAIVSEYPPGTEVRKYHFPARNRIIVGLAVAVVIVQAPHRSGALFSATFALDGGRPLYVHAVGAAEKDGIAVNSGSAALVDDGAPVVDSLADIPSDPLMALSTGPYRRPGKDANGGGADGVDANGVGGSSGGQVGQTAERLALDNIFGPALATGTLATAREALVGSLR